MPTSIGSPSSSISRRRCAYRRVVGLRHAEADAQIGERHDVAAHVDHARRRRPARRHLGDRHGIEDLAHRPASSANISLAESDHQDLHRVGLTFASVVHRSSRRLADLRCSSMLDWPSATRCATSRISAAVPSPRMVAPGEDRRRRHAACDSDLITVWWLPMIWSTTRPTRGLAGRDDDHLLMPVGRARRANRSRAAAGTARDCRAR